MRRPARQKRQDLRIWHGLRLGMTMEAVQARLGPPLTTERADAETPVSYACSWHYLGPGTEALGLCFKARTLLAILQIDPDGRVVRMEHQLAEGDASANPYLHAAGLCPAKKETTP